MANNEIIIMMIGPEAVGKTTLLATMYKELLTIKDQSNFDFIAQNDTGIDLEEAYQKLRTITTQPTFTRVGRLLPGTAGIIERKFDIYFHDKKELDIMFCDVAGGLILTKEGNQDFEDFKNKLSQAIVTINVIDGAALVEGSELLSNSINQPTRIRDLLLPALKTQKDSLVLFVVTKCETWLKTKKGQRKLQRAFEERYGEVLNLIEGRKNVTGVLIPVKTLGCVEFSRIEGKGEDEEIVFVRKPNLEFNPEFVDQPLRYALAFALSHHDQKRSMWSKLWRTLMLEDIRFKESLEHFAYERNRDFKIYGNASIIEVDKK